MERHFEARLRKHVLKYFESSCASLGEEDFATLLQLGIQRAQAHGFVAESDVCKFVDLMFVFGVDFDRDPAYTWILRILRKKTEPDPSKRMRLLHATAILHATEGRGLRLRGAR
jgi:hypothetical protein